MELGHQEYQEPVFALDFDLGQHLPQVPGHHESAQVSVMQMRWSRGIGACIRFGSGV